MKTLKRITFGLLAISTLTLTTGCFGTYGLTKKVYKWNEKVTDSNFANSLIMWGLIIIPVYEISLLVDLVIINTIEFWSGSNPMAMNEGETDTQIVASGDKVYEVTASKNQFHIEQIKGADAGQSVDLVYHSNEAAWYLNSGDENIKLAQGDMDNNAWVKVFHPNGKVEKMVLN